MSESRYKKVDAKVVKQLGQLVDPARVLTSPEVLLAYSYDATKREMLPEVVVRARSPEEVAEVLAFANREVIPVYPRGAGSGMTGGALPMFAGMVLDLTLMNRILDVNVRNLTAVVEPGVVVADFQEVVEKEGLSYPPDPASHEFSTMGGTVAECAGGLRGVKYGVTRDYVLALETVLPDGSIIHTGRGTLKSVTGYDVTRFLIGSEGTLGVFTKITVKLVPLPEMLYTMVLLFDAPERSARWITEVLASRLVPRALEFLDGATFALIQRHEDFGFPRNAGALVLVELDGESSSVMKERARMRALAERVGVLEIREAEDKKQRDQLWDMRRACSPAILSEYPQRINEDICVPRDQLAEMLNRLEGLSKKYGIPLANFGHAGDGNIHVNLLLKSKDAEQLARAHEMVREVFRTTVGLGGTLSGEHGIGITKAEFLNLEVGGRELELMRQLKRVFDPRNILNPGKIFPTDAKPGIHFQAT